MKNVLSFRILLFAIAINILSVCLPVLDRRTANSFSISSIENAHAKYSVKKTESNLYRSGYEYLSWSILEDVSDNFWVDLEGLTSGSTQSKQQNEAERLYQEGLRQFQADNLDEAISYMERARRHFREIGDRRGVADSLFFIGLLKTILEDYYVAIKYLDAALVVAREIGYAQLEQDANGALEIAYRDLRQSNDRICFREDEIIEEIQQGNIGDRFVISSVLPIENGSDVSITFGLRRSGSSLRLLVIPGCQGDNVVYNIDRQGNRNILLDRWSSGSVARFSGRFRLGGFLSGESAILVNGNENNPLAFALIENIGMVYLYGSGSITLEDGTTVELP
jgi:tetratricopeptide (TPR) repeat protein